MAHVSEDRDAARVGVVVVTYRRPDVLAGTLRRVLEQTCQPARIVVVDNAADDDVRESLRSLSPRITYLAATENSGFGAGLADGLHSLAGDDLDFFWLLDDDSPPATNALCEALLIANADTSIGVVANRGGHIRWGRIRHDLGAGAVTVQEEADFALVDGAVITREATRRAGLPRRDLFMMMEDFDYTTRIVDSGLRVVVRPADDSHFGHMGSTGPTSAWRGYYQSRNLLRIAVDRRKPGWIWGWLVREVGICGHHMFVGNWSSIKLRLMGAFDGIRNRMGRTVEPH